MIEVELVGGPHAGRRVTVQPGIHEIVMPVMRPVEVFRKVVPFRRGPDPSWDEARYLRAGDVYRYEGLIGDAWSDMALTEQAVVEGGPALRRYVRQYMHEAIQELAPDKEIDGIVWRIQREAMIGMYRVRARVGQRRVELGLRDRQERRNPSRHASRHQQ